MADMEKWEQDRLINAWKKAVVLRTALMGLSNDPKFDCYLMDELADMAERIEYDVRSIENGAPLELREYDTELLRQELATREHGRMKTDASDQPDEPESGD